MELRRHKCLHAKRLLPPSVATQGILRTLPLCIVLIAAITGCPSHADINRKLRWEVNVAEVNPHQGSESLMSGSSRRLLQAESGSSRDSLKLRVLHRNSFDSPARKHFGSREEEIEDLIAMDEMRVKGFSANVIKLGRQDAGDDSDNTSQRSLSPPAPLPDDLDADGAPASSPAPEPSLHEEFQGRVVSGASFPGNIGQYFVEFSIGSPPQTFLFIADTGSDLVWAPCSLCTDNCTGIVSPGPNTGSVFLPANSSTFAPIKCSAEECGLIPPPAAGNSSCSAKDPASCTYGYSYSDSSQTTGVFGYDTVTMSTSSGERVEINNVAFGCGTNNSGPSITRMGGVIGLGQGPISFTSQVGYMYGNKFSYCFTSFFNRKARSALVFGDDLVGTELVSSKQYTPFLTNPQSETFYYIGIEAVEVGGDRLPIQPELWNIKTDGTGGAVMDSGTTLTFFVRPAYEVISKAIAEGMGAYPLASPTAGLPICYNVSGMGVPRLPQLTIIFGGGAVFKPPTKNYFLSPKEDLRCLGFLGSSSLTVLGNLLQQNYHVEYDRLHNRLGFAKARCSLS